MAIVLKKDELTIEQQNLIVKLLSIERKVNDMTFWNGRMMKKESPFSFYMINKDLVHIPYAFGNKLLGKFVHDKKKYHEIKFNFKSELRPRQLKKINKLDYLFENNRTATFCAHTGFGKTRTANYYISKFGLLSIVLVPNSMLMLQWAQAIKDVLEGVRVGVVGENYKYQEYDKDHPDVLVCMPDRWSYINPEIRDKIGLMIIDEAHMFCSEKRSQTLLQFAPKYILALTASPQRQDNAMGVITSLCGPDKVRARYPNHVKVLCFTTRLVFETLKNGKGQTNWSGTVKKITEDENRNLLIVDIVGYVVKDLKRKPLLMCDRKEHVKILYDLICSVGISCDYLMENKNTYKNSEVLIAIVAKAGTGFDEQYACPEFNGSRIDTVIYCTSFKEINGLIQYGGRAFRADNPLLIHIVDNNSIIESHWKKAQKYYLSKEYLKNVSIEYTDANKIWGESEVI